MPVPVCSLGLPCLTAAVGSRSAVQHMVPFSKRPTLELRILIGIEGIWPCQVTSLLSACLLITLSVFAYDFSSKSDHCSLFTMTLIHQFHCNVGMFVDVLKLKN